LLTHAESEDNDEFIVLDGMRLQLDELVSEDIYLALPSRFLCKEDCKGLCAFCGQDLNEGQCSCNAPTDSRWDSLKDLFNEQLSLLGGNKNGSSCKKSIKGKKR
jgi:uncharacterized protein